MLKKILTTVAVLALCVVQSKAETQTPKPIDIDDKRLLMSTPGPDMYADGTPVLNNEMYALIWIRDGFSFAGMKSNGELVDPVNNILHGAIPLAEGYPDSHCPLIQSVIKGEVIRSKYQGGSFSLFLLDTRRYGSDGTVSVGSLPLLSVNGYDSVLENASDNGKGQVDPTEISLLETTPPENVSMASITSIIPATKIDNAFIELSVVNTDDTIVYSIEYGDSVDSIGDKQSTPQNGKTGETIQFRIPQDGSNGVYRLIRKK